MRRERDGILIGAGAGLTLTVLLVLQSLIGSGLFSTRTLTLTSTSTTISTKTLTSFSSVLLGNTALVLNSSDGLGLSIQVIEGLNGNYTFTVRESNLLNSVDNVTETDGWAYPQDSVRPCGPDPNANPVELAVVQGHYSQDNYTSGKALPFYNIGYPYPCGELEFVGGPYAFAFQPE
jgi:hypothetical protein